MKYLKKFNENINTDTYSEISRDDFNNKSNSEHIDFTPNEISRLEKFGEISKFKGKENIDNYIIIGSRGRNVYSFKDDDHWYYICYFNHFFKCDDFGGLIDFLIKAFGKVNESTSNSTFELIDSDDYYAIANMELINFTKNEIDKFKSISTIEPYTKGPLVLQPKHATIYLYKVEDRWIYASYVDLRNIRKDRVIYAKCDDIDGAIDFIYSDGDINESNNYYDEIERDDYYDDKYDSIDFEKFEIDILNQIENIEVKISNANNSQKITLHNKNRSTIYIEKIKDEWYLVKFLDMERLWKYYKCDQLDGLVDFIKSLISVDVNESNYYEEIEKSEYHYNHKYDSIPFTQIEINKIGSIENLEMKTITNPHNIKEINRIQIRYDNKNGITIKKSNDDWYLLTVHKDMRDKRSNPPYDVAYYKCDQLEGLIEFLENFKSETMNESTSYYNEVDKYEYYESNDDNRIPFTEGELNKLKAIENTELEKTTWGGFGNHKTHPVIMVVYIRVYPNNDGKITLVVKKEKDDWYLVRAININGGSVYYKCDQFEGLITLIETLISGNINESLSTNLLPYNKINLEQFKKEVTNRAEFYKSEVDRLDSIVDRYNGEHFWRKIKSKYVDSNADMYYNAFKEKTYKFGGWTSLPDDIISHTKPMYVITNEDNDKVMYITKNDDDYFFAYVAGKGAKYKSPTTADLRDRNDYIVTVMGVYKCDEFDGLVDFLNDLPGLRFF